MYQLAPSPLSVWEGFFQAYHLLDLQSLFFFPFPYCCRPAEWGNAFCQSPNILWWTVAPTEIIHQALTACFFITILFISSIYFGLELFCAFECGVCILEGEQLHTSFKELMKCRKSGDQPVPELCLESPNLAVSCKAICFLGGILDFILFFKLLVLKIVLFQKDVWRKEEGWSHRPIPWEDSLVPCLTHQHHQLGLGKTPCWKPWRDTISLCHQYWSRLTSGTWHKQLPMNWRKSGMEIEQTHTNFKIFSREILPILVQSLFFSA